MTYRVRNIVIAVGLALVAMMLTLFYVTNYKRSVQQSESEVQVYVAARDVAAGTSGKELVKSHAFTVAHVTKRSVVAGAISSPDQVERLVLSQPMYQGEQITLRRFSDQAALGIRAQLKGTLRAVQVPGAANQLLAGTLKDGDHVDIVTSLDVSPSGGTARHYTRIALRDLTVLQAPTVPSSAKVDASATTSAILAVSDTQVQRLFFVLKNSEWTLELRPVVDAADSGERADSVDSVLHAGLSRAAWDRAVNGGN